MARMVSRPRRREGRGIGEKISEYAVFVAIAVVIVLAVRWYLVTYRNAPGTALAEYIGAMKRGDVATQFDMLAASTKQQFGTKQEYDKKWGPAHGFAARIANFNIEQITEQGNKATADVTLTIRKSGLEVYQTGSDNYKDRYVMVKEADGWKVLLEKSELKSVAAAPAPMR